MLNSQVSFEVCELVVDCIEPFGSSVGNSKRVFDLFKTCVNTFLVRSDIGDVASVRLKLYCNRLNELSDCTARSCFHRE